MTLSLAISSCIYVAAEFSLVFPLYENFPVLIWKKVSCVTQIKFVATKLMDQRTGGSVD